MSFSIFFKKKGNIFGLVDELRYYCCSYGLECDIMVVVSKLGPKQYEVYDSKVVLEKKKLMFMNVHLVLHVFMKFFLV